MGGFDDPVEALTVFYLEKGHIGAAPADLHVYELALELELMPEVVRHTPREDLYWLKGVKRAQGHARAEIARRQAEKLPPAGKG